MITAMASNRALTLFEPGPQPVLKAGAFLSRDPCVVERKSMVRIKLAAAPSSRSAIQLDGESQLFKFESRASACFFVVCVFREPSPLDAGACQALSECPPTAIAPECCASRAGPHQRPLRPVSEKRKQQGSDDQAGNGERKEQDHVPVDQFKTKEQRGDQHSENRCR